MDGLPGHGWHGQDARATTELGRRSWVNNTGKEDLPENDCVVSAQD